MDTEKYSRWQQRTIEQLGFSINLILTLALGGLAFVLSAHTKAPDECIARCLFLEGAVLLLLSAMCGIISSITRLYDFRLTAQTCREENETVKAQLRAATKRLGTFTWFFFWLEVVSFVLGTGAIVVLTLRNLCK